MKYLKKIIACIVTVATLGSLTVSPINASATTYKKGDVNGNGVVDVSDQTALKQFLLGIKSADGATAERLDLNRDYVIDDTDLTELKKIVLNINSTSTVTSVNTTALPTQEDRTYYVYNAKSGDMIDSYELDKLEVPVITSTSTRGIIGGVDERVPENGLNGVIKTSTGGTAFVIDAHTILTVAHCVYKYDRENPTNNNPTKCIKDIKFSFYGNYNVPISVTTTALQCHIPQEYIEYGDRNYDYAIVTVKEDLSNYVNFNLGIVREGIISSTKVGPDIYVTGFGSINEDNKDEYPGVNTSLINGDKTTGVGKLVLQNNVLGNYKLAFTTDILPGNSGSPIYTNRNGVKTVIGIQNSQSSDHVTANYGIRITTDILQFVYNNSHLS